MTTATTVPQPAMDLVVRIDHHRAGSLYGLSYCSATLDFEDRFEATGRAGTYEHDETQWEHATLMWCASPLEAFVLADYETACGYRAETLWDLDAAVANWSTANVVLSSRPCSIHSA